MTLIGEPQVLTYIDVSARVDGVDEDFAFYLVAIANAGSTVGRVVGGLLTDRVGESSQPPKCIVAEPSYRSTQYYDSFNTPCWHHDIHLAFREEQRRVHRRRPNLRVCTVLVSDTALADTDTCTARRRVGLSLFS